MDRMRHIDHHTLELYVLGSRTVKGRRRQISAHLSRCPDCQHIADEIHTFYAEAEKVAGSSRILSAESQRAVVPFTRETPAPQPRRNVAPVPVRPRPLVLAVHFFRLHPAASGAGVIAILGAALLLILNPFSGNVGKDPAYFQYDLSQNLLKVYSRGDQLVWQKPCVKLQEYAQRELYNRSSFTVVADLDADNHNEVVTMVPAVSGDSNPREGLVRVFQSDGNLASEVKLGHPVSYRGHSYSVDYFWANGLATIRESAADERAIIAAAVNYRSPSVVTRISRKGEILGEYWHYGHILALYVAMSQDAQTERVILLVKNDEGEERNDKFPAIVMLDPNRITGKTESSTTRGFSYDLSNAELAYVRIPGCDMYATMGVQHEVVRMLPEDQESLRFLVRGAAQASPMFEFIFDKNMSIRSVLSMDGNVAVHDSLRALGRISSTYDKKYLERLKDSVRYWDGRVWVNTPTRVMASPVVATSAPPSFH